MIFSYIKGWLKTSEVFTDLNQEDFIKISILVAARNEADRIEKCLESIVAQNYNKEFFEIILLDDFSEDETVSLAKSFNSVKIIQLSDVLDESFKSKSNKKRAISYGVSKASNEYIITVDADCSYGENWLKGMTQAFYKKQSKLLTAPVLFYEEKGIFSKFLELDIISLMGITAASIKNQEPSMVNGANLMFRKQDFLELNAFKDNENVASGDDIFLMQKINKAFPNKIHFLKNKDAIAFTDAPKSFSEFVNQRIRWTSKSSRYADKNIKLTLTLNYFFNLFILISFVSSFINFQYLIVGVFMLLIKFIIDAIFFMNVLSFFELKKLMRSFIFIDLLHILYISILGLLSLVGKYTWKGRDGVN